MFENSGKIYNNFFFFFFNYKTGLELPSFYLHAFHGLPLSFHGSCLARKKKNKKKAALKGVFDIDFNKPLLIQQKYSFAIAIDLVVISKEVKRLYIYSNES